MSFVAVRQCMAARCSAQDVRRPFDPANVIGSIQGCGSLAVHFGFFSRKPLLALTFSTNCRIFEWSTCLGYNCSKQCFTTENAFISSCLLIPIEPWLASFPIWRRLIMRSLFANNLGSVIFPILASNGKRAPFSLVLATPKSSSKNSATVRKRLTHASESHQNVSNDFSKFVLTFFGTLSFTFGLMIRSAGQKNLGLNTVTYSLLLHSS